MMEWKECTIGDLGRIVTGKTPKTSIAENYGGNIPFLSPSDDMSYKSSPSTARKLTELGVKEVKNCMLPKNAVCVSCIGSDLGKVVIATEPLVTNQQINSIITHKNIDADFVYYLMSIVGKELNYLSKTSTAVPIINKSTFSNYKISIPSSLDDQRRIASILSSLDRKIELNNKINAELEEMAQAIFKSWFVDFEPFKVGADGSAPTYGSGEFIDSELGRIPKGWRVGTLGEIAKIDSGYSYKGTELKESNDAMVTIKNFDRRGGFKIDGFKEICISDRVKSSHYVELFDLLVAHTDLTQNAEIIGNPILLLSKLGYNNIIMSMDLCKVSSISENTSSALLYYLLKNKDFKSHALGYVNGTTVLHMSKKAIPEYKFPFPNDTNVIKALDNTLLSIVTRIKNNIDQSTHLSQLRDTLLPKLMKGEIKLDEYEC